MKSTGLLPALLPALAGLLLAAVAGAQPASVADLPLLEFPADSGRPYLAVVLTGDGGWADLDRQISARFIAAGVPVVGWSSLKYYWVRRTPEEASGDLERILAFYLAKWKKSRAVLVGYSRGADVLPFLVSRLPPERRRQIQLLAMLGLATHNRFESLASAYTHLGPQAPNLPLAPELEKLAGLRMLGFYGAEEADSLCKSAAPGPLQCIELSGAHHFGGSYAQIAERILAEL